MNKYIFVPDFFKYDEEFEVEGENCVEAMRTVEEFMCLNVAFTVFKHIPCGIQYVGELHIYEGNIEFYEFTPDDVGLVRSEPK